MHVAHRLDLELYQLRNMLDSPFQQREAVDGFMAPMESNFRLRFADMVRDRQDYFIPFDRVSERGTGAFVVAEWTVSRPIVPFTGCRSPPFI